MLREGQDLNFVRHLAGIARHLTEHLTFRNVIVSEARNALCHGLGVNIWRTRLFNIHRIETCVAPAVRVSAKC